MTARLMYFVENPCLDSNICENGGECIVALSEDSHYACQCVDGNHGNNCEIGKQIELIENKTTTSENSSANDVLRWRQSIRLTNMCIICSTISLVAHIASTSIRQDEA